MSLSFRPVIAGFTAYAPGLSIEAVRERYGVERVIKLASNENPLGISPQVCEAISRHAKNAFRYPAGGNPRLIRALSDLHGVAPERIVLGNGSDEIIDLLFRLLPEPGKHNAVVFKPCFGIYTTQGRLAGVEMREVLLAGDFSFTWKDILRRVDENTRLVFVTSPDNPSGRLATRQELRALAEKLPPTCLLVLDEAYIDFAGPGPEADKDEYMGFLPRLDEFPNVAILRTFSKSRGLAGMRLGYGILPTQVAEYYWRVRLPFSVNLLAEEAALAALEDTVFYAETLRVVREGRSTLLQAIKELKCCVYPSEANFVCFRVPDYCKAADVHEALLRQGIIIRPLCSYGLPQHMRVTVGTSEENQLFLHALESTLENC